jgi:hypothetical protein
MGEGPYRFDAPMLFLLLCMYVDVPWSTSSSCTPIILLAHLLS